MKRYRLTRFYEPKLKTCKQPLKIVAAEMVQYGRGEYVKYKAARFEIERWKAIAEACAIAKTKSQARELLLAGGKG
ncbi:MAG: hypothetical protein DRQ35_01265 [Gammaproteobacteria bacterium]|nr:MAG: hypothetical protein DRQ35_01265 [Gammaproteobacteria bacterium]